MWKAYFPRAHIFGVDIHDKSRLEEEGVKIFRADQSDPQSLLDVADEIATIDVLVDDGSHLSEHVITTFQTLFPKLATHGGGLGM